MQKNNNNKTNYIMCQGLTSVLKAGSGRGGRVRVGGEEGCYSLRLGRGGLSGQSSCEVRGGGNRLEQREQGKRNKHQSMQPHTTHANGHTFLNSQAGTSIVVPRGLGRGKGDLLFGGYKVSFWEW